MPLPYEGYSALQVHVDRGVAFVTIDYPPINLLDEEAHYFNQSVATTEASNRMAAFMAIGGQTREVELGGIGLTDKSSG